MRERDDVAALIDGIVRGARIAGRSAREDLRRELQAHFEDAGGSPGDALRRFGEESAIAESLRRVYRPDYILLYAVKVAGSILASIAVAMIIQAANLRLSSNVWRVLGFTHVAGLSAAVVLSFVTAWEICRPPFSRVRALVGIGAYAAASAAAQLVWQGGAGLMATAAVLAAFGIACSSLERRFARLIVLLAAFAAIEYVSHLPLHIAFGPWRAVATGVALAAIWTATRVILARADSAFASAFA